MCLHDFFPVFPSEYCEYFETARNCLTLNMLVEIIVQITKLSKEEVTAHALTFKRD